MIVLSNLTAQTLQPGQALTFDNVILKSGNCECWSKQLPTSVKLKAPCAIYKLEFSGNITGAAAAVLQIAMGIGTQPIIETGMNAVPAAEGDLSNVHTSTLFKNGCGDANRISIINTGTVPVTIAPNSAFVIQRRS